MAYTANRNEPSRGRTQGGTSGNPMQVVLVVIAVILVVVAAAWIFKSTRGDTNEASARAEKFATPEAVARQYDTSNMPAQARAAAAAAAAAHGAPMQPTAPSSK